MQSLSISITVNNYNNSGNEQQCGCAHKEEQSWPNIYEESMGHTVKKAVGYLGDSGVFSFCLANGDKINVSMTAGNISRFKEKFGDEIKQTSCDSYTLDGKAAKYAAAFWEYFTAKQPDCDKNGYINFEEYKNSDSFLIGYDEKNQMPITTKISNGFTDEELEKMGITKCTIESVDLLFNALIEFDMNMDGTIDKTELGYQCANEACDSEQTAQNILFVKWLLWFLDGMQDDDEKKKLLKKQSELEDSTTIRRKIMEAVNGLPDIKDSGKLGGLLQDIKSSLK